MRGLWLWLFAGVVTLGCGDDARTSLQEGERWFRDPKLASADADLNRFSCATCHAVDATLGEGDRYLSGGSLFDVVSRPKWWHGDKTTLLDAVNTCLTFFMRAPKPLGPEDPRGRALFAFLLRHSPNPSAPARASSVERFIVAAPEGGDGARGQGIYEAACQRCHGEVGSGRGKLDPTATTLPEGTASYEQDFPGVAKAVVVTEKVRHGQFFGVGGVMPFFTLEVLPDQDLADILAFLDP